MSSLVIGLTVLALILVKQVRPRPLNNGAALVLVLGVLGLAETGSFLFGQHQFGQFVTGHHQHLAAVVPGPRMVVIAAAGSLLLAAVTGALRAPSIRLWRQDGQIWQRGTVVTVVLWLVALGLHLGYDALVTPGLGRGFRRCQPDAVLRRVDRRPAGGAHRPRPATGPPRCPGIMSGCSRSPTSWSGPGCWW
jgi:hypothetical protein